MEDALIATGPDEDNAEFDALVQQRMEEELASMTGGKAPEDMARVLRTVFALKQKGEIAEASTAQINLCKSRDAWFRRLAVRRLPVRFKTSHSKLQLKLDCHCR